MNLLYNINISSYQDTNFWASLLNEGDTPDGNVDSFDTDDIDEVDTLDISLKETTTTSLKQLMGSLRDFKKVFKKRDKDGDGSLSKEEFLSAVKGDKKEGMEKFFVYG